VVLFTKEEDYNLAHFDNMKSRNFIIGAGFTGLTTGIDDDLTLVFEKENFPGGLCASYYIDLSGRKYPGRLSKETFRFERGGGHWIWASARDSQYIEFLKQFSELKFYERKAAVYFRKWDLIVPYPLQFNLNLLPGELKEKIKKDMRNVGETQANSLKEWLYNNFGETLCEIFFFPFNEKYTAGLLDKISLKDEYKTPIIKERIIESLERPSYGQEFGYNPKFFYPVNGLDALIAKMALRANISYEKEVVQIDTKRKEIIFSDGDGFKFDKLISTLPLKTLMQFSGMSDESDFLLHNSLLVLNIGAIRGRMKIDYHWLYIPESKSGFHRIGFYSNVDREFLPESLANDENIISLYVEKAYPMNSKLKQDDLKKSVKDIVEELKEWQIIEKELIVDFTWVPIAYCWESTETPQNYKEIIRNKYKSFGIFSTGRYGKWETQGVIDSIKDGFLAKGWIENG